MSLSFLCNKNSIILKNLYINKFRILILQHIWTCVTVSGDDLSENPVATETDSEEIEEIELPDLNNDDNDVDAEPGPSTSARLLWFKQPMIYSHFLL